MKRLLCILLTFWIIGITMISLTGNEAKSYIYYNTSICFDISEQKFVCFEGIETLSISTASEILITGNVNFGTIEFGETQPAARSMTVINTGNSNIIIAALPIIENWTLAPGVNWTAEFVPNQIKTLTIRPNDGLAIGTYNPTIIINNIEQNTVITINPTLTVVPRTTPAPIVIVENIDETTLTVNANAPRISPTPNPWTTEFRLLSADGNLVIHDWQTSGTFTGLIQNTQYQIEARFLANDTNHETSAIETLNVSTTISTITPIFEISTIDNINFGTIEFGETQLAAKTVTVTNTGNSNVTMAALPIIENWTLTPETSWTTEFAPDETRTFTVLPNVSFFSVGTHTKEITIATNYIGQNAIITINPTFTIVPRTTPAPIVTVENIDETTLTVNANAPRISPTPNPWTTEFRLLSSDGNLLINNWQTSGTFTGLTQNTQYQVEARFLANDTNHETSTIGMLNVSTTSATPIFKILITGNINFGTIKFGETQPAARTVTVINTGNSNVTMAALPIIENWTLTPGANWTTEFAPNETRTFTIRPNDGLAAGRYNPAITISTTIENVYSIIHPMFEVTRPSPPNNNNGSDRTSCRSTNNFRLEPPDLNKNITETPPSSDTTNIQEQQDSDHISGDIESETYEDNPQYQSETPSISNITEVQNNLKDSNVVNNETYITAIALELVDTYDTSSDRLPIEHIDTTTNKRMVTYPLSRIENNSGYTVTRFSIISKPSRTLRFHSGEIPAFSFGSGITYTILFRTDSSPVNQVFASGVSAAKPFRFYNTTGEIWTEITLFFDQVPNGFAHGNIIYYTFKIIDKNHYHEYSLLMGSPLTNLVNLSSRIAMLENLILTTTDPEVVERLNLILENMLELLTDTSATDTQILNTIAEVDSIIAEIASVDMTANPSLGYSKNLLLLLIGILSLVGLFIAFILKRKMKKNMKMQMPH